MTGSSSPPLRRRSPWSVLVAILALATAAGCASGGTTPQAPAVPSGAPASTSPPATVVMVIRHAEKPSGNDQGYDAQGNVDPSSLTRTGWERANKLVGLLDPAQGDPPGGLARPTAIYAAGANDDGEGLRPRETVMPLAAKLGITVNTDYGKGDEEKLVAQASAEPGPTLISWQHEEIPDIAKAFDGVSPKPPKDWPDDRFDMIWTFTRTADGWSFAQVPEMLLPGDSTKDIKG